ncbi:sugar phosphate isomerase/epimerase family protein [Membranihabitans maritimus]|uniref:sugar phosphate isomerase/epimerase family protein n=1 Tax=Membranihabitans maritimus TaxID=2904244 RepID=UPI001F1C76B0|nr:sugar phosphate isomerase/epimerase family protein [Membranihabitans maritimus]
MTIEELPFRFGSEVYTWFMKNEGKAYEGKLGHMIEVISSSGFEGIQPIFSWMGELRDSERLSDKLDEEGIELSALSLVLDWNHDGETEFERREADEAIELLENFPGAVLCTVQMPTSRKDLVKRRENLIKNVNAVSQRASDKGVTCSFHPNSPETSITRTEEDYKVILEGLNASVTGWTPDVGHIINGGMDPLEKMKEYESLINHLHYKDWDGNPEFVLMGKGKIDLIKITQWLKDIEFDGWIVCEDEGQEALKDPDWVTEHDGDWIHNTLIPEIR